MKKRISPQNLFNALIVFIILYNVYLSAVGVFHNDIGFNTDLARDFLLLQDVLQSHKLPLIGPRSGGISGVFHGPLWIYVNLPAFVMGQGNPVIVGWFWIALVIVLLGVVYYIGRKLYGRTVGLLAALLVSSFSVTTAATLFNPFGAVLVSLLFFYYLYKYLETHAFRSLLIALFVLGIIIQFQVAFGGPLLVLTVPLLLYSFIKKKKYSHASAFFILLLPLSTYIIFDMRHEFLQLNSLISYISGHGGEVKNFTFNDFLNNRYNGFVSGLVSLPYPPEYVKYLILVYFAYLGFRLLKDPTKKKDRFILLFFYFYVGFWAMTLLFRGIVWGYYYWPFLPVVAVILAAGLQKMNKYLFITFFGIIMLFATTYAYTHVQSYNQSYIGKDAGSWVFNQKLAQVIFAQQDKQFGYYIFSPDEFGYSPRYAMDYEAKKHANVTISPYKKERITYLIISSAGGENNSIGGTWWKENRVKIQKKPVQTWDFPNGFKIEKYELSESEIKVESDPNMIQNLMFR